MRRADTGSLDRRLSRVVFCFTRASVDAPSGEQTRQVFSRADVSFTLDGVLYTGTILQYVDKKDFAGTGQHETLHLNVTGEDGSTIQAHLFYDREGEVESVRVVCPGN